MDIENNTQTVAPTNAKNINSLSAQIKELEEYNQKKKNEINNLLDSDNASKVTEMQEEIVILYEELQRMGEMKKQIDLMVKEATTNLEQTIKTFSPETVAKNKKTIQSLEQEIANQEERNKIARENLLKKESQTNDEEIEHAKFVMQSSIQILKKSIEEEEREIAQINAEIARQQNSD
ncbi:hypothetical protein TRFO_30650 [Tritrichomonas foetus]|uniref:Uncharacterized protein n=1 Tax=Tritrichomonas foetus TaxID=1144522 RepID=A0A1J4JT06_9EUKA|nr:hypothetical protein TRFO_30650 [Tritrichomonas foetus]|eukprot:OHT02247.1 hypothetical protein TRFO_30650 [Tritrichomonas foetus]